MLKGIDVSHHQNTIDWPSVKMDGYSFAFVKLTEGHTYIDPMGVKNVQGAKKAGLMVGGYHFGRFNDVETAKKEADFFRSVAKNLDYVILDIEQKEAHGDLTEAALVFLDRVSDLGVAVLYSNPAFIHAHFNRIITKYPLWVAHYGVKHPELYLWSDWSVWQHADDGQVKGIKGHVDINVMKPEFAIQKPKPVIKPKSTYHTVIKGDTIWGIAKSNHTTVKELDRLNPSIKDLSKIFPGQKVRIK